MTKVLSIAPEEIGKDPFTLIGKDWFLLTATDQEGNYNTMTASWGGVGVLWNKPVCFLFVRPGRHTHLFTDRGDHFTLSFLPEEYRAALRFCGSHSGRDVNKVRECGFTPERDENGAVYFGEASLVLSVKKLYKTEMKKEHFLDAGLLKNYEGGDYHTVYICQITGAMRK